MEEQIAVVDDSNRFLRWAPRSEIHEARLLHRSVYVLVIDDDGRLLVQRRHSDKQTFPGHWDLSCAGHLCAEDYPGGPDDDLDEVYRTTAERELHEELGIVAPLRWLGVLSPEAGGRYEHVYVYLARHQGPVVVQASEVEAVQWLSRDAFDAFVRDEHTPVTPSQSSSSDRDL